MRLAYGGVAVCLLAAGCRALSALYPQWVAPPNEAVLAGAAFVAGGIAVFWIGAWGWRQSWR